MNANAQVITQTYGCNKFICKYVGKIDEQNYVVVSTSGNKNGSLITIATFLNNTNISSPKLNEEKAFDKQNYKKPSQRTKNKFNGTNSNYVGVQRSSYQFEFHKYTNYAF